MTQQFDEGVKEVLMALLSLGATMYETDYVIDQLKKRPEPIEQKIQALNQVEQRTSDPVKIDKIQKVKTQIKKVAPAKELPSSQAKKVSTASSKYKKEEYIFNRLVRGGLTPKAAIGIVANIKAESELDPTIKQYGGGPGRGLVQWEKGGRFDTDRINLISFARKRGTQWTDLNTQIDFILFELNVHPEYKRVKQLLNNAKSTEEATKIFLTKYEKAGIPHIGKRLKYASDLESILTNV